MERPRRRRKKLAALKRKGRTTTRSERARVQRDRYAKRTYAKLTVRYCTAVSVKAETGREGDLNYSVRDLSYSGGHLGVI
jgi:hypothetical protein